MRTWITPGVRSTRCVTAVVHSTQVGIVVLSPMHTCLDVVDAEAVPVACTDRTLGDGPATDTAHPVVTVGDPDPGAVPARDVEAHGQTQ